MDRIRKLDDSTIDKIAAGEVVERPAYALKELIENSIDAKAKNITVHLKNQGLEEIKVVDDGVGIFKKDLKIATKSHTTSKIKTEKDLLKVKSLGFRGEALAAITAISEWQIKSNGYQLSSSNSKVTPTPMPPGTQVAVKKIFSKTPARKKFMASKETEYRHLIYQFQNFALSRTDINFNLFHNEKKVYSVRAPDISGRVSEIFDPLYAQNLIETKIDDGYIKINGFISHPQINFKNKNKLFIYVNERKVQNASLFEALRSSYKNLLMSDSFPFAVLFVKLNEDLIDVNVHPRKELIRFFDEKQVVQLIKESVWDSLKNSNLTFSNLGFSRGIMQSEIAKELKTMSKSFEELNIGKVTNRSRFFQIHNKYIAVETQRGVMFLDQHAAHEAILYQKFKSELDKKVSHKLKRILDKPVIVKLKKPEISILTENKQVLFDAGFEFEEFGKDTFKISAVASISTQEPKKALQTALDTLEKNQIYTPADLQYLISTLACKSAIKSGQKLESQDIEKIIQNLGQIDFGYTCPHGRPVKIEFSISYLDKLFKRS